MSPTEFKSLRSRTRPGRGLNCLNGEGGKVKILQKELRTRTQESLAEHQG